MVDLAKLDNEEMIHTKMSGPLLGVKITGDINVPRGEYTFIVSDMGPEGTLRIATEQPFTGARVVGAVSHCAGDLMQNEYYAPAQMFLLSHNRVAMYWQHLGHITYYERVDIDKFFRERD